MIIHDQSFDDYLSAPGIGSSAAKLVLKSVQLFRDYQTGIYTVGDKSHHQIGRLAHAAVLEPQRFAQMVVSEGPVNERTGKAYGRDTQAWAAWQAENPEKVVVDSWLLTMLERIPNEVKGLFVGGRSEVSVHHKLSVSGLDVKCRCDYLRERSILDFKTCEDVDRFDRELSKWSYWFQLGWYKMVMKAETGVDHTFRFVFAEKKPPFRWRIVPLDVEYQMYADAQVEDALGKLIEARDSGNWSDRGEVEQMASLPDYLNDDEETTQEEE